MTNKLIILSVIVNIYHIFRGPAQKSTSLVNTKSIIPIKAFNSYLYLPVFIKKQFITPLNQSQIKNILFQFIEWSSIYSWQNHRISHEFKADIKSFHIKPQTNKSFSLLTKILETPKYLIL